MRLCTCERLELEQVRLLMDIFKFQHQLRSCSVTKECRVLGGSVVPLTLLFSDGLMAGSSVGGSCEYHKVLRTKPQVQRKRTQGAPQFKDSKPGSLALESIPKQASRSCWLCGLSARSPGDLPSSSLRQPLHPLEPKRYQHAITQKAP